MTYENLTEEGMNAYHSIRRGVCQVLPNAIVRHRDGLNITWSGTNFIFLNTITPEPSLTSLDQLGAGLRSAQDQFELLETNGSSGAFGFDANKLMTGVSVEILQNTLT
jgi:hypothetical protein